MHSDRKQNIVVAMSGGVDSSVAAALLLEQGHQVSGVFMKNWEEDDTDEVCAAEDDLKQAQAVCDKLGIELRTVNFSYEYWERVFQDFLDELRSGRTPNPDILCNVEIKFREFPKWALQSGVDFVATGHYARIRRSDGALQLLRGVDDDKDQTYFLYGLQPQALERVLFPVGQMTKQAVRKKAKQLGLANHDRKGSTGICFIGRRNFRTFVSRFVNTTRGESITPNGAVVGEHDGAELYTIGQRTGLGIGGPGESWYVADKDISENTLIVVQGHDHPLLYSSVAEVKLLNWITPPKQNFSHVTAKIRYRSPDVPCSVVLISKTKAKVEFAAPVRAVTPGQSVVFYSGDVCLGGGVIDCVVRNG